MNESEFHRAVDAVLARIERAAEATEGIDCDLEAGILTLECPDGSRIIVNRQTPNREIWVAARSGGFHFAWKDGAWREKLSALKAIDWSKKNPDWQNVCIIANSVVSNRQARAATKAYVKCKLGLQLADGEQISMALATQPQPAIIQ